jgi:hypothetical protein
VAGLMPRHRTVAPDHWGRGREVLCLDWSYVHHDRGSHIWGVKQRWDHVAKRQTVAAGWGRRQRRGRQWPPAEGDGGSGGVKMPL